MLRAGLIFCTGLTVFTQTAKAADSMEKGPISCQPVPAIHFAEKKTSAHFEGSIERWQQACYSFSAKKGQHLNIELEDFNNSVGLTIYRPGYNIDYGNYTDKNKYIAGWGTRRFPKNTYAGKTLTPPPEMQTTPMRTYATLLPQSGTYLLVVDLSEAGASTFGGKISIR